ncbi:hypothetical protein OSTOST_13660, partial [Ostertagia ostertagi]
MIREEKTSVGKMNLLISQLDAAATINLKRRSAYAFSIFANEEREKLMKTHPDLPMGLVTRMPADAIPESIPSKKLRPIIPYTKISLPVNDQPIRVETVTEQQPGKVIFVQ